MYYYYQRLETNFTLSVETVSLNDNFAQVFVSYYSELEIAKLFLGPLSLSIPSDNRKSLIFRCFQGYVEIAAI